MAYAADDFEGAAGALTAPWVQANTGTTVVRTGTGTVVPNITGQVAQAYQSIAAGLAQEVTFTIGTLGGAGAFAGGLLRGTDTGTAVGTGFDGYTVEVVTGGNTVRVNHWVDGGFAGERASWTLSSPNNPQAGDTFRVTVSNSTTAPVFTLYRNSVQVGTSVTDSTSAGLGGVPQGMGVGVMFFTDGAVTDIPITAWEGGDLGGVVGGTPTQLAFTTQPSGATTGTDFDTQPVVEIRDAGGALVPTATNAVTFTVATGSGTIAGTVTVNAVAGIARPTNLRIVGTGAHTITAAASGLSSATSSSITVGAAPAQKQSVVTVHDQTDAILAGKTVTYASSNPAVATVDSSGNVVAVAAGSCTVKATCEGVESNVMAVTVV